MFGGSPQGGPAPGCHLCQGKRTQVRPWFCVEDKLHLPFGRQGWGGGGKGALRGRAPHLRCSQARLMSELRENVGFALEKAKDLIFLGQCVGSTYRTPTLSQVCVAAGPLPPCWLRGQVQAASHTAGPTIMGCSSVFTLLFVREASRDPTASPTALPRGGLYNGPRTPPAGQASSHCPPPPPPGPEAHVPNSPAHCIATDSPSLCKTPVMVQPELVEPSVGHLQPV